jgi:NAD(P)H dehydrogenase (quinone)
MLFHVYCILLCMKILIVTAHPSPYGYTHEIANVYAKAKRSMSDEVKVVDLYNRDNVIPYLKFKSLRERPISKIQKKFQEQILWAHEIVVIHPIWWGLPPAIMKNWVDEAFWAGVEYKFTKTGKLKRLTHHKIAKVFATAGGPGWLYKIPMVMPLSYFWKNSVFGFNGIDVLDLKICGSMDKMSKEKCKEHFDKFLEDVRNSALKIR